MENQNTSVKIVLKFSRIKNKMNTHNIKKANNHSESLIGAVEKDLGSVHNRNRPSLTGNVHNTTEVKDE